MVKYTISYLHCLNKTKILQRATCSSDIAIDLKQRELTFPSSYGATSFLLALLLAASNIVQYFTY